ncbi:Formin, FH2 domain containing protein [Trema orientale]|uniref:Formin-like protein n=1 Tax=Trema orientale TaxID=63057 RepID=A0A2P5BT08_TREOI|nr:Formin, FH2 domain containing protein [Trema orientale]
MVLRRAFYTVVFVILLCALAIGDSEGNRKTLEAFLKNGDGCVTQAMDEKLAELAWIHCSKLVDRKYAVKDSDFYIPHETSSASKSAFLTKRSRQKAMIVLPPHRKRELFDCLRKRNVIFLASNKKASSAWFLKCVELIFGWSSTPRRYLITTAVQTITRTHSPTRSAISQSNSQKQAVAPAVASPSYGPTPSPSPSQIPGEAPDPFLRQDIIDSMPSTSPHKNSPPEAPDKNFPPQEFIDSPPRPSLHKHSSPPLPSEHFDENQMRRIVIVGTAAGILLVISLLLFCCFKESKRNRDGQKDEKPLLTLASSDFSAGSSQKSISMGNSSNKEFSTSSGKFVSNVSMKSENYDSSLAEATSSEATVSSLKPPPGKPAPPPPGPPSPPPPGPRPPPPPKARPPPAPPKAMPGKSQPHRKTNSDSSHGDDSDAESRAQKAKLKPFFWDKTVLTNPDQSMVWHEISSGSFQFNEEMIESLFGYNTVDKNKKERKKELSTSEAPIQYIQIIETKKAQNLSILLRALNVTTEEVIDALREGNELPVDLLQSLLKVQPTTEEELKLRLFTGDLLQLGPAERFLKVLVDIPFAFKRLESLLFMCSFQEEVSSVKESLTTLEVASNKLRSSRLFLKLLEAVLKTGNRMNDGTYRGGAQAFRLDTLLKLADVKGTDGKTTLLHFVVKEIIRSEGVRAARTAGSSRSMSSVRTEDFVEDHNEGGSAEHFRSLGLEVVSGLGNELEDVRKAAVVDADSLKSTISKLGHSLLKTRDFVKAEMSNLNEDSEFHRTLASFVEQAESDTTKLLDEEKRIMALVKSTTDYFHGNAGKDEGLRLFVIVRDFLIMLDKVCKEVKNSAAKPTKNSNSKKDAPTVHASPEIHQSLSDVRQRLFPAIAERRVEDSSSDEESSSP